MLSHRRFVQLALALALAFALAGTAVPALALAAPSQALGFDIPETTRELDIGPSKNAAGQIKLRCFVYPDFAVAEIHDPGIKGGRIELRMRPPVEKRGGKRDPTRETDAMCARQVKGAVVVSDGEWGSFVGAAARFLIVDTVDGAGLLVGFRLYEAPTGKQLDGDRDIGADVRIGRKGRTLSLDYRLAIQVTDCKLAQDTQVCWGKVARARRIPRSVHAPDCRTAFQAASAPLDGDADVSVPARIANLARPRLEIMPGDATCSPSE